MNKSKRRVLHVTSSLKLGGAETILVNLIKYLPDYEHYVIYFHDGPMREKLEELNISTYNIRGKIFRYDLFFLIEFFKRIKIIKPNVIHSLLWAANFFGALFAKITKIPVICAMHTVRAHQGILRNLFDSFYLKYANKIVAVSDNVANSFKGKIPKNKLIIINNGVDFDDFQVIRLKRKINDETKKYFTIGAVGRLVKVKQFDVLIKSFANLREKYNNIKLIIIGHGPEFKNLKKLIQSLNLSSDIKLLTGQSTDYYHLFDCFVQPSKFEGLSIALLEAMAIGIPCIVTSQNGVHDVIENNINGIIIKPNDNQMLENALISLCENKNKRKSLANQGLFKVKEKFSIVNTAKIYGKIFEVCFYN